MRGIAGRQALPLIDDRVLYALRKIRRGRHKETSRVGSVFGLRHQVSSDPARMAVNSENDSFGRTGGEVDGTVRTDELLGCGDIAIARAEDFFNARNLFCAVCEGSNRLRTANPCQSPNAQQVCNSK